MALVALKGGAYKAQSLIADAQRCVNLYSERNAEGAPVPFTYYPTPGLLRVAQPPSAGAGRCLYRASNGQLYTVVGQNVYAVSDSWVYTLLGTISSPANPCYIQDNGVDAILVDGTSNGYKWDLATNTFTTIVDPDFYGGDRIDYVDLRFVLNKPGTPIFYYSDPTSTTFQPLDFAAKSGYPDKLVSVIACLGQIWLLGELTTEIFYNAGAVDAIFQRAPGSYMEHGCSAPYSVAKADVWTFWVGQDMQGRRMVYQGLNYQAQRISTHALENEMNKYPTVLDAVGFTYQQNGHLFYVISFPTANKTWCFDKSTGDWHERSWTDPTNGTQNRYRGNLGAFAYDKNLVVDWENGSIFEMNLSIFVDDGNPVVRVRSFPHMVQNGQRVTYAQFQSYMEAGAIPDDVTPLIGLRWSDDGGQTWGQTVLQNMGRTGAYNTAVSWNRLGMGRDRVFELSWSVNAKTALNGAFVDPGQVSRS